MKTLAILPVKSFAAAKQRLAEALGAGSRVALAQAMFADVLMSVRRVPGLHGIGVLGVRHRTPPGRVRISPPEKVIVSSDHYDGSLTVMTGCSRANLPAVHRPSPRSAANRMIGPAN